MKPQISAALTLLVLAFASCKKYNTGTSYPSPGKKWIVTTVAGEGSPTYADGPALSAKFRAPQDVAVTSNGDIYVADALNHRIRKISGGVVTTFAGTGIQDTISGTGINAAFSHPYRLAADKAGHIFTIDVNDFRVRTITAAALVTVAAGSGVRGFANGEKSAARFGLCTGLCIDEFGNVYVADEDNLRIRVITLAGNVVTYAGSGQRGLAEGEANVAQFLDPSGIVMDKSSNLFVADENRIRKIAPGGVVSTFATSFRSIEDIVIDEQGNLYVTDDNHIKKITPDRSVTTIAGSSTAG